MNKRFLPLVALALTALASSCSGCGEGKQCCQQQTAAATDSLEGRSTLIGKTLALDYGSMRAEVYYGQDTLRWTTYSNEGKSVDKGDELAAYEALGADRFLVTWQEADGTAVSQIVDLRELTVLAHITAPISDQAENRQPMALVGAVQILKEDK